MPRYRILFHCISISTTLYLASHGDFSNSFSIFHKFVESVVRSMLKSYNLKKQYVFHTHDFGQTSKSFIIGTGLKKCKPPKFDLFFKFAPISASCSEDVFVAKRADLKYFHSLIFLQPNLGTITFSLLFSLLLFPLTFFFLLFSLLLFSPNLQINFKIITGEK